MQLEPGHHDEIKGVERIFEIYIGAHDSMGAAVVEEHFHHVVRHAGAAAGLSPHRALAIDGCEQWYRRPAEGTGSRAGHIPKRADLADEGVTQRFRAYVHSALGKFFEDLI